MDSFDRNELKDLRPTDVPPKLRGDILKIGDACDRWLRNRGLAADPFNPRYELPRAGEAES